MREQMFIKKSRIQDGQLVGTQGFMWRNDTRTKKAFEQQRVFNVGYKEGAYCLDLHAGSGDLLETITVEEDPYEGCE